MKTFEFIMKAEGGKIIIDMPKELEGKELKIEISEINQPVDDFRTFAEMPVEERLKILKQFQGTAKYHDTDISKYDVYDQ